MNNKEIIEREEFTEIFNKYIDYDLFEKVMYDKNETDSFYILYDVWDEILNILSKDTLDHHLKMISWYKVWHVGRCLNLEGFKNKEEIEEFLIELGQELKEEDKQC